MIGQKLKGRYGIDAEFYTDKLGTAYKATDHQDGVPVVVIVLDEQVSTGGGEVSALLLAAGRVRELDSPLLVPTIASGITDDGKVFLVHPLPDAVTLKSLVKGGMPIEQVVDLTRQIAMAASVAGEAGLQHLDLSSSSVLVTVLSDGGQVARVSRYGYQSLLPLYSTVKKNLPFYGTAEYMAPELCSGKGADPHSDIYSLGILMYEMVVGKCPFVSNNVQTVLKRQIFEKPLPLHLLKRGVAGINEFEKIVFQALQKMPARRQESMAQLVEQLDVFRAGFLAEAELTPLPPAAWPEIGGADQSVMPVPEEAAEEAERRPAETMMFSGITPAQIAAGATEPDASAAAAMAEVEPPEDLGTLKMSYAAAERAVEEAIAERTEDQIAAAAPTAAEVDVEAPPEKEESWQKTLMMAPIPAAAVEAAAAAEAMAAPTPGPDDDWFVDSAQDLAGKESAPQSWGEHKTGSNIRFYVSIGAIAVLIVVLILVVMHYSKVGDKPEEETEKALIDPAMERQLEQERKTEAARKAAEDQGRKIREASAAEKAAREKVASEEAAQKAAAEAIAAEERAALETKRTKLTDRFLAVRTRGQGLRNQLSERRGKWASEGAEEKMAELDQAIVSLDRIIAPDKMQSLANDMAGEALGTVEGRVERLEGQIAAFKVRADRLLIEAAPVTADVPVEAAATGAEEEAAKKAAEEAAAAKAAEEAAAAKVAEEAAAKKAAEEAAAKKAAEDAAVKKDSGGDAAAQKAAADAAKKKEAEEVAKKAAKDAAAKKAAEAAAAKKAAEDAATTTAGADQGKVLMKDGISAYKKGKWGEAVSTFEKAKAAGGNADLADKYIAKAKSKLDEAKAQADADAAAKKAADDAAAKQATDAAAAKKAADAAAAKQATDDAAAKKVADAAAAKQATDAAAAKKAAADAAAKKAAAAAAAKKAADDAAAKTSDSGKDAAKAKKYMKLGIAASKKGSQALAIKYFEKAKGYADDPSLADKWIEKTKKAQSEN
ncbi:MAG: protein kinase [Pseudomonadota bacterium]